MSIMVGFLLGYVVFQVVVPKMHDVHFRRTNWTCKTPQSFVFEPPLDWRLIVSACHHRWSMMKHKIFMSSPVNKNSVRAERPSQYIIPVSDPAHKPGRHGRSVSRNTAEGKWTNKSYVITPHVTLLVTDFTYEGRQFCEITPFSR